MTTLCLSDYCPPRVRIDERARAVRLAVIERCDYYKLEPRDRLDAVAQALSQLRNGVSAARSIEVGYDRASMLANRSLRSPRT